MSREFMNHLFEEFSREQTSTVSKQEGTGLGLSIAQRITDLMDGRIDVQSTLGKGSTFVLTVPFKLMTEEEVSKHLSEKEMKHARVEVKAGALKGKKVLLVEDNELNREIAYDILSEQGLEVTSAEDGALAVDIVEKMFMRGIREEYFDFILMDIQMPVMNGYEATKRIRLMNDPHHVHIPIIAMTANAFSDDMKMAFDCGMDAHISKPVGVKILVEKLTSFV